MAIKREGCKRGVAVEGERGERCMSIERERERDKRGTAIQRERERQERREHQERWRQ